MCKRCLTKIKRNTQNWLKSLWFFSEFRYCRMKRRATYDISLSHPFSKGLERIN